MVEQAPTGTLQAPLLTNRKTDFQRVYSAVTRPEGPGEGGGWDVQPRVQPHHMVTSAGRHGGESPLQVQHQVNRSSAPLLTRQHPTTTASSAPPSVSPPLFLNYYFNKTVSNSTAHSAIAQGLQLFIRQNFCLNCTDTDV